MIWNFHRCLFHCDYLIFHSCCIGYLLFHSDWIFLIHWCCIFHLLINHCWISCLWIHWILHDLLLCYCVHNFFFFIHYFLDHLANFGSFFLLLILGSIFFLLLLLERLQLELICIILWQLKCFAFGDFLPDLKICLNSWLLGLLHGFLLIFFWVFSHINLHYLGNTHPWGVWFSLLGWLANYRLSIDFLLTRILFSINYLFGFCDFKRNALDILVHFFNILTELFKWFCFALDWAATARLLWQFSFASWLAGIAGCLRLSWLGGFDWVDPVWDLGDLVVDLLDHVYHSHLKLVAT